MLYAAILMGGLLLGAEAQVGLGTAAPFNVLAATTITNTGLTVVDGQLGIYPNGGTSITGFPPGISGGVHGGDAVAKQAQVDATSAYNKAAALASTKALTGQDLGGMTLLLGVYTFTSSAGLTGILTLDAQGDPNAQWVFQIGSTLTTASASSVRLINGANACNVFWQVGSSATLGTGTTFAGNILAHTSITVTTGCSVNGGLYALTAAVTLDTDKVTQCQGSAVVTSASTTAKPTTTTTASAATSTITSTITVIVTQSPSTVTVTDTGTVTSTKTVSTSYTTCTSTKTSTSTRSVTTTRPTPACKTHKNAKRGASQKTKTIYHTVTSTKKAGSPKTVSTGAQKTKTVKTTCTSTSTHWRTTVTTKSTTQTVTPRCTTTRAVRRYERF